jgi:chromosome segregation ATPase
MIIFTQIRGAVMNKEDKILSILETMQTDVSSLKTDVSSLKNDVSSLKNKVDNIETNIEQMQKDLTGVRNTVAVIEVEHGRKLNLLYETMPEKIKKVDELQHTVEKLKFGNEVIRFLSYIEGKQAT